MLLVILLTLLLIFLFHELYWKRRNYPPGPTPLPILGNVLSLRNPAPGFDAFNRWLREYGDVHTFWLGSKPYILISSYEALRETFIKDGDTFADKTPMPFQSAFRGGSYGVVETNGEQWREHRRFALHQLRDFGLGKDLMQQKMLIEVEDLFKFGDNSQNIEVNIVEKMDRAVGNVINQMLFGYRFDESKQDEFNKIRGYFNFQKDFNNFKMRIQFLMPWTGRFIPGPTILERFKTYQVGFDEFFGRQIAEHRRQVDFDNEQSHDYVEAYLKEQRRREAAGDAESFSDKQLVNMCLDLWFAALSTTSNTLEWAFALILNNPLAQQRMHDELDAVIGSDRLVTTADKAQLVYTCAVINEIQRCANVIPLNLLHRTTRDTVIKGFPVKKGTGVIAQISTVMFDEKHFPEPRTFKPERFIEDGKLKKVDELLPFSAGKRQCLGEGLARMELFLFIANFFNRYKILPGADGPPCVDHNKLGSMHTNSYKIRLQRRNVL